VRTIVTETIANAVAQRDTSPAGLIRKYSGDFATVLPSHVNSATWVRLAEGALRKGKRITDQQSPQRGMFELEAAAANNPGVFMASLLDAARLGLEPGTEQYYLTPRKVKGRLEILGIVGYQGHIELMYRAGAVSAIIAEVVRENDEYRYQRGVDDVPQHRWKPFARDAERGRLVGVYAYARMVNGAVSRVVELNQDDIDRIKLSSQGANGEHSPWRNHEVAMWLKSAVRQLQKWVPTSAEYRREQARAAGEAQRVAQAQPDPVVAEAVDSYRSGGDVLDGELVDDVPAGEDGWPEAAQPGGGQ
jgi:recombination protein RecT